MSDRFMAAPGSLSAQTSQYLARLAMHFGDALFSTAEAAECLDASKRSINTFIKDALNAKRVAQTGAGPRCRYRIMK